MHLEFNQILENTKRPVYMQSTSPTIKKGDAPVKSQIKIKEIIFSKEDSDQIAELWMLLKQQDEIRQEIKKRKKQKQIERIEKEEDQFCYQMYLKNLEEQRWRKKKEGLSSFFSCITNLFTKKPRNENLVPTITKDQTSLIEEQSENDDQTLKHD